MSDREAVLNELRALHESERKTWIKSKEIAPRLGWSTQKVGYHLRQAYEAGVVEKWGDGQAVNTNNAWRLASGADV